MKSLLSGYFGHNSTDLSNKVLEEVYTEFDDLTEKKTQKIVLIALLSYCMDRQTLNIK